MFFNLYQKLNYISHLKYVLNFIIFIFYMLQYKHHPIIITHTSPHHHP
jgi:hypothetical protein